RRWSAHLKPTRGHLRPPLFFPSRERPLDAAWMDGGGESLGDLPSELRGPQRGLALSYGLEKVDDLGRQLVAAPWPALLRQQPGEPAFLKRALGLIEGRA